MNVTIIIPIFNLKEDRLSNFKCTLNNIMDQIEDANIIVDIKLKTKCSVNPS